MPLVNPGTPVWDLEAERIFDFLGVDYPEHTAAQSAAQTAYQNWHNAVGGNPALGIPRNEALASLHDAIKARTNNPALPEPREPFWNAQARTIGFIAPHADEQLVRELKQIYMTHAGPETEALARAHLELHTHAINLHEAQLGVVRRATSLQGMDDRVFTETVKPNLVSSIEEGLSHVRTTKTHLETYLAEMPALRGEAPPPPPPPIVTPHTTSYAASTTQAASHLSNGSKWAIAGAIGVAALGVGAYILNQHNKKKEEKPHRGEPMNVDTVQLGAQQMPGMEQRLHTSNLSLKPNGSVSIT